MFKKLFVCLVALLLLQGCTTMVGIVLGVDSMTYCMMDYDFIADKNERQKACEENAKFYADIDTKVRQQEAQESAAYAQSDTKKTLDALGAGIVAVGNAYQQKQTAGSNYSSGNAAGQAPGNANHCMRFHDAPNGRSLTIENACPFRIQTYRCHSEGSLGLACISTMPIRPNYHDGSHYIAFSHEGTTFLYGACKGNCDPGGSFFIDDGASPNCECKSSTGSAGTAR
ncbi:MAG: hypothetical protein V4607_08440 [Pseudomonadota bacterium]